jgi:Fe-S cluster assembly protein SufB
MSISEAIREHPGTGEEVSRFGRSDDRQLLCDAELGRLHRRLVRVRAEGRSLPDGAVDLLPHQREEHRPVRAHADHCEEGAYVSYLEGCTAPQRDENQLHAAVVELVALDDAEIKYSTVQNWYPGDKEGKGGIYNFVTKRGDCRGKNSKISWTQVETGSAITWKYPSCILRGDGSRGEFYSIAVSNGHQQIDSGTKMIHLGKNTSSRIVSKGISAGFSNNTYRGQVSAHRKAENARNFTQCDSLLIGDKCGAHTVPYIEAKNATAHFEHEATTSKISEDQLFYCLQRGIPRKRPSR